MTRRDIMVDIETLGKKEGSSIFQISAASFDIKTGEIFDTVDLIGNISDYAELSVDGDTLKWWLTTDAELFSTLLNRPGYSEKQMVSKFYEWIVNQGSSKDVYLWGNGILFDNAKIQSVMTKFGIKYPILYKNDRDVRTILDLASSKLGINENDIRNSVTSEFERAHDAFDDVKKQIRLVTKCYEIIAGGIA